MIDLLQVPSQSYLLGSKCTTYILHYKQLQIDNTYKTAGITIGIQYLKRKHYFTY